jgi:hypothetical protein
MNAHTPEARRLMVAALYDTRARSLADPPGWAWRAALAALGWWLAAVVIGAALGWGIGWVDHHTLNLPGRIFG